jgi:exodeoxyribonuclease V beta subunit
VVWWAAPSTNKGKDPVLCEVLCQATDAEDPPLAAADLATLVTRSEHTVDAHDVLDPPPLPAALPPPPPPALEVSTARRCLDEPWRIWSFSSITAVARERTAARNDATAAPEQGGHDEALDPVAPPADRVATAWDALPAGTQFGTLVHRVFERVDFTSPTLPDDLVATARDEVTRQRVAADPTLLATAVQAAIETPLGGPLGGLRLLDLPRTDRLDELKFHLPLAALPSSALGEVLAAHLADDDPLLGWARAVADGRLRVDVEGMLTGSIDLVARAVTTEGTTRYVVADYKSNRLDPDRTPDGSYLADVMSHAHYPLQASLYLVALHRFLRARLTAYRVDQHLGGAAYLFLRAMQPDADSPRGVFWWTPPSGAIEALDRLIGEGVSA